jgi:hypothetical protein
LESTGCRSQPLAFAQLNAGLLGHHVQFAGPGVAQTAGRRWVPCPSRDTISVVMRGCAASWRDTSRIAESHCSGLYALAPVEPGQVRDEAFDAEHPVWVEHASDVAEAPSVPGLA